MPLYESVVIARQDISSTQFDALAGELTKILEENGGSVKKREDWGLRSLAFRIKKNRKGHFVLFNVDAPAEAITEYERRMRINEDILRYMTVRVEQHEEGPSAIIQSKGRGGGRVERGGGRYDSGRRSESGDGNKSGVEAKAKAKAKAETETETETTQAAEGET